MARYLGFAAVTCSVVLGLVALGQVYPEFFQRRLIEAAMGITTLVRGLRGP